MGFETLRSLPRVVLPSHGEAFDLAYELRADPQEMTPRIQQSRAVAGRVLSLSSRQYDKLLLVQDDIPDADREKWRRIEQRALLEGYPVVLIRDSERCMFVPGCFEDGRCVRTGVLPFSGSTFTYEPHVGRVRQGAIGSYSADPSGWSRTNLVESGDFIDPITGVWTNSTPSTLSIGLDSWLPPHPDWQNIRFTSLADGTKTATTTVTLPAGKTIADLASVGTPALHFRHRTDLPGSAGAALLSTLKVIHPSGSPSVNLSSVTSYQDWRRSVFLPDLSAWTGSQTTLTLEWTLANTLKAGNLYISGLQMEPQACATGFVPYSLAANRNLTGSRGSAQTLRYINHLAAYHQQPRAWGGTYRFRMFGQCEVHVGWDTAPADPIVFLDTAHVAGVAAPLRFYLSYSAGTGAYTAHFPCTDGTEVVSSSAGYDPPSRSNPITIGASWLDWDGSASSSGYRALLINGGVAASTTHSKSLAALGQWIYLGAAADGTARAQAAIRNLVLDPVYVKSDGDDVAASYYNADASVVPDALTMQRNSWQGYLDPSQKDYLVSLSGNTYTLSGRFVEGAW